MPKKKEKPPVDDLSTPDVSEVATGAKLAALLDGFEPFDDTMRRETKERRDKDSAKVAAMKAEMQRLEDSLRDNVRLNASMNEALQSHCDSELAKAREAFDSLLEHQRQRVHERLDALERRVDELEAKFAAEKERILREIADRSAQLSKLLDEFQVAFEKERASRVVREAGISERMQRHETKVDAKFAEEKAARCASVAEIHAELEHCIASRRNADDQLNAVCTRELATIQHLLEAEVRQRELSDDNIVKALNQYTNKLQNSLNIINSTNT